MVVSEHALSSSRRHMGGGIQLTPDELGQLRNTIEQLRVELHEEKSRVDALKSCLDQERDKYIKVCSSMDGQPQSLFVPPPNPGGGANSAASGSVNSKGQLQSIQELDNGEQQTSNDQVPKKPNKSGQQLDEEVLLYYSRKLETESMQKMQYQNQVIVIYIFGLLNVT